MVLGEQGSVLRPQTSAGPGGAAGSPRHRAGVLGSPIAHSLSPVLHRAAYRALGLTDWTYERVRVQQDELAEHLRGLDASWRGLSLTMPLKEAAVQVAHTVSDLVRAVGAANTLVRDGPGWAAHNTDVYGVAQALREAGASAVRHVALLGSGATARSVLAAVASLGAARVTFLVRGEVRPATLAYARVLGLAVEVGPLGRWPSADVVVGTVPPEAYAVPSIHAPRRDRPVVALDCVYGSAPSPLLTAARQAGYAAVPGTEMLLHQAGAQVRLMTGRPAPVEAMRAALTTHLASGGGSG